MPNLSASYSRLHLNRARRSTIAKIADEDGFLNEASVAELVDRLCRPPRPAHPRKTRAYQNRKANSQGLSLCWRETDSNPRPPIKVSSVLAPCMRSGPRKS